MRKNYFHIAFILALAVLLGACMQKAPESKAGNYVLVIHGGAGTILKKNMTPEREARGASEASKPQA